MNARGLRRYVDDLLRGRRPRPFHPDEFEAAQLRTAIDLRAARLGGDAPREEFLTGLRSRLAEQMEGAPATTPKRWATRRQVMIGTSAAAAAAVGAVTADRLLFSTHTGGSPATADGGELVPNTGSWQVVAASNEVADGDLRAFQVGSLIGFVRRVDGRAEAISGVCTHQGCRLWFDKPDDTLRCPCHTTSFSTAGQVLTHQLPIAPSPLPRLEAREVNGFIEVLAPTPPARPS
jgi:Rieske Fe-S protein